MIAAAPHLQVPRLPVPEPLPGPLGPIRLDFALPILKGKYDQTQFFNFSGGASF